MMRNSRAGRIILKIIILPVSVKTSRGGDINMVKWYEFAEW